MTIKKNYITGDRVILISFQNQIQPPVGIADKENYWKLIGETGMIVQDEMKIHPAYKALGPRLLVKFDKDIQDIGLICHSPIANTLWIFMSDLQSI